MTETGSFQHEMFIEAPPATIFAFLTDPDKMIRWMGVSHELDPKPGGTYRVDVMKGHVTLGEFQEVSPNDRLVYSFGWEGEETSVPPGSSVVTFVLSPEGNGTKVSLVHSGLPVAALEGHKRGWLHYGDRLCKAAAGIDPGPDTGP
jgi:uncharacterized protein YndB with AHSA1/START domain